MKSVGWHCKERFKKSLELANNYEFIFYKWQRSSSVQSLISKVCWLFKSTNHILIHLLFRIDCIFLLLSTKYKYIYISSKNDDFFYDGERTPLTSRQEEILLRHVTDAFISIRPPTAVRSVEVYLRTPIEREKTNN